MPTPLITHSIPMHLLEKVELSLGRVLKKATKLQLIGFVVPKTKKKDNEMNNDLVQQAVEAASQAPVAPARPVPYGPVPMSWNVSQAQTNEGQPLVVISIMTPEGDKIFFLQPSIAKQIGEAVLKMSSAADSGLILPS